MAAREPAVNTDGGLVRVRLDLSYAGVNFSGWARQPAQRTVEGVLGEALGTVLRLGAAAELTVAGRTDAGVHARGQVAHLDVARVRWDSLPGRTGLAPGPALVRRLAGVLPPDVRVLAAEPAPPGFDARFSAVWRRYAYRVSDAAWGVDPLRRDVLWWPRSEGPLRVEAMQQASQSLLGLHDFAAFCRRREGATSVRTLQRFSWARVVGGADAGLVVATVVADAFCHSMVRSLVGALLPVGAGGRPSGFPAEVLASERRDSRVSVAPAHGLTLEEVGYPPDQLLAARAGEARARRTAPAAQNPV